MMGLLRRGALALATLILVVIALVVAVTVFVFPRPEFQRWVTGHLARSLGSGVAFGSVSFSLVPAPGIRLREIRLGGGDADASVEAIHVTLATAELLRGALVVDRLAFEHPALAVTREADGRWILGEWLDPVIANIRRADRESGSGRADSPRRRVPRLFVHGGILRFDDRRVAGGPVSLSIRDLAVEFTAPEASEAGQLLLSATGDGGQRLAIDLRLDPMSAGTLLSEVPFRADVRGESLRSDSALLYLLNGLPIRNAGGRFDIEGSVGGSLSGQIDGSAVVVAKGGVVRGWGLEFDTPVRLSAEFQVKSGSFSMNAAELTAPAGRFDRFEAKAVKGEFDWNAGVLDVHRLELAAYGGVWESQGSCDFRGTPSYRAGIRATDADYRQLASAVTGTTIDDGFELASLDADVNGEWTGADDWLDDVRGDATLQLRAGELESMPITSSVFSALAARVPGFLQFAERDAATTRTTLDTFTATASIAAGGATTRDLVATTSTYRLEGAGRVGFDGSLRLSLKVLFDSRGLSRLYAVATVPFREGDHTTLPAIPVEVDGTFDEPRVVPNLSEISMSPFHGLFGTAGTAMGVLRDVATPEGRPLRRGIERVFGRGDPVDGAQAGKSGPEDVVDAPAAP